MDQLCFTIVNPADNRIQNPVDIIPVLDHFALYVNGNVVAHIDNQQMMELGAMLIAIAGKNVDFDSAGELLDGFELSPLPIRHLADVLS